jgi:hypothetical protein
MTFELPNLDLIQAQQELDGLMRRIPGYAPGWTDHNPSDPGVTLLQMFVWLAEGTGYTANAVPLENYRNMLRWVLGLSSALCNPNETDYDTQFPYSKYADGPSQDSAYGTLRETLKQVELHAPLGYAALQEAVVDFRRTPFLAITPADLAALTAQLQGYLDAKGGDPPPTGLLHVARICLQQRGDVTDLFLVNDNDYTYSDPAGAAGVFSVSLDAPADELDREATLLTGAREYFAARTVLGSAISLRNARLLDFDVQCEVRCFARESADEVAAAVLTALERAIRPVRQDGGREWAYGARIDEAAVMPVIASTPGVDWVRTLTVNLSAGAIGPYRPVGGKLPPLTSGRTAQGLPRLRRAQVTVLEADDD